MAAAALVVGVACSAAMPVWPGARAAALAALALLAPASVNIVHERRPRPALILDSCLLCALLLAAGSYYEVRHRRVPSDDICLRARGEEVAVSATVIESRTRANAPARVVARCVRVTGQGFVGPGHPASGLVWLTWPEGRAAPRRGDTVRARGRLAVPTGPRNPAAFDFRRYLRDRGVHAVLRADRVEVEPGALGPEQAAAWVRSRVGARLGPRAGAILIGLLLGEASGIDADLLDSLRRTGTVHVTAVSGLHVGFIVLIAYALLRTARLPPRAARLLVLPALASFVLIVGPRASVLRASVMATCLIVSTSIERRVHALNALGVAALVLVLARPGVVFDLGFGLSFSAATGITLLFEPTRAALRRGTVRLGRVGERLADALAISVSAQAGVSPLLVALFGRLSVVAPLANLVVVPAAAFSVSSGIAMLAAEAIAPPLAPVFAASAWAGLAIIDRAATLLGERPWAAVPVAAAYWPCVLAAVLGLALIARLGGTARRRAGACTLAVCLALALAAAFLGPGRSFPRAVFFDVGQGDAALFEIPWRRYVLVDAGPGASGSRRYDAGRGVIVPYLMRNGIERLEAVVVTHAHDDHRGGTGAVLEHAACDELVLPIGGALEPGLDSLVAAARLAGSSVREVARGDTILAAPRATITVLGPPAAWRQKAPSENDRSVVLLASIAGARMLLTGDVEAPAERRLLSHVRNLSADVLKVAHHGSSSSTTPAFLNAVRPRLAVCSVGLRNRHGHPDDDVIERIRGRGAEVFRTDRDGAVLVWVRGDRIRARSLKNDLSIVGDLHRCTLAPGGPTRTLAARSTSITRRAAVRTSSAETASTSVANRSP